MSSNTDAMEDTAHTATLHEMLGEQEPQEEVEEEALAFDTCEAWVLL